MEKANAEKFIKKVLKLAGKNAAENSGGPFAAIIVRKNKIVSFARNRVTRKNDPTAHAEIEAIRKAAKKLKNFNLSDCVIFSSCKPCPMCLGAIYWAGIKKLYYSADTKTAAKYGFKDLLIFKELAKPESKRKVRMTRVDNPAEELPFKIWKNSPGKKKY